MCDLLKTLGLHQENYFDRTLAMKLIHRLLAITAIVAFAFTQTNCASNGSLTPGGAAAINLAATVLASSASAYAASNPKNTGAAIASQELNANLSGVAALTQAYVGQTVAQANLTTGSTNPAIGAAVTKTLGPDTIITQPLVNTLYTSAAMAAPATPALPKP